MLTPAWLDPPLPAVRAVVARALEEDLGVLGDLTAGLVPPAAAVRAVLAARQDGVLAGRLSADEAFGVVDPGVAVDWLVADGERVSPGTVIARVGGRLAPVLTAERTALNLLGHLSGIATFTRRFVDAAGPSARIRDARKTTPGLRALVGGRVQVEVSGRVALETVAAYAAAGADLISVGALTHSAPVLDIGLDLDAGTAGSTDL